MGFILMIKNWQTRYLSTLPADIAWLSPRRSFSRQASSALPLMVILFLSIPLSACATSLKDSPTQSKAQPIKQNNDDEQFSSLAVNPPDKVALEENTPDSNLEKTGQSVDNKSESNQGEIKASQTDRRESAPTETNPNQSDLTDSENTDPENTDSEYSTSASSDKISTDTTSPTRPGNSELQAEHIHSNSGSLNANERNRIQDSLNQNPWLFLHGYNATYEITADGDKLGQATRNMSNEDGAWRLEISTKLKKWFLTLKSQEISQFEIENNQLLTKQFYSNTKLSFKKDRIVQQDFNWDNKTETGTGGKSDWTLPLDEPVFDRMNHMLKLRADLLRNKEEFNYLISYKGKRKYYSYSRAESEKLTTSFGEFDTVKMVRTSGDDSNFTVWLSPELNYFPIKIAQFEQDKPDVVMTLSDLKFTTPVDIAIK